MSANPLISAIRHHRISPDRDQRYNSGLTNGIVIDATALIAQVVDEIVSSKRSKHIATTPELGIRHQAWTHRDSCLTDQFDRITPTGDRAENPGNTPAVLTSGNRAAITSLKTPR
jgi:hypothetical protein